MSSILDDAILKMLPNATSITDEIADYIILSGNTNLKRSYYQNVKLSANNFKLVMRLERDFSLLLILFSLYWKKREFREEFFMARNKKIRFLALCYITTSERNFLKVTSQLGKPYIKKQGYLLDNYLPGEKLTPKAANFLISLLPPAHMIEKEYFLTDEFVSSFHRRLRSFGKESFNVNYYY